MNLIRFHSSRRNASVTAVGTCLLLTAVLMARLPAAGGTEIKYDPVDTPAQSVNVGMITTGMLMDVVNTGKRLVAVGERGHVITSDDKGTTWRQSDVPVSVTLTDVHFPTALKGWAVGFGGVIIHTEDGGLTWSKQIDGTVIPAMIVEGIDFLISKLESPAPADALDGEGNADRIADLRFLKEDWQEYAGADTCPPFMDVWFKNENQGFAVGAYGLMMRTENGGVDWQPLLEGIDNPDGFHYYDMIECGDKLFMVGEAGMAFHSADWGKTWTRIEMPYEGSFFGIVSGLKGQRLVAFGLRGNIVQSTDGGSQWQLLDQRAHSSGLSGGCAASDGAMFLTGPAGSIYKLSAGGNLLTPLPEECADAVTLVEAEPGLLVCVGLRGVATITY